MSTCTFKTVLLDAGSNKVAVIKATRDLTGLSLTAAKDLVDGAPSIILDFVDEHEAEVGKAILEDAGADATTG